MKSVAYSFLCLILLANLAGCFGDEEVGKAGFQWPEESLGDCESNNPELICNEYLVGFETPVQTIRNPNGGEIWIVDLSGNITAWDGVQKREVFNMYDLVSHCHYEQGLFSIAFDENFSTSNKLLISYVEDGPCEGPVDSNLIIAEAEMDSETGTIINESLTTLMEIYEPYRNHNGGYLLSIGNQEFLLGVGDGGSSHDPNSTGQNMSSKLGSILIFKYDGQSISPIGLEHSGDPYVLHYGLRNPWRFALDGSDGLFIADVGQNCFEEINHITNLYETNNFGWSLREGFHVRERGHDCDAPLAVHSENITDPVFEYSHHDGNCSITGGDFMDWGPEIFQGSYVYSDFCTGSVWILQSNDMDGWYSTKIVDTGKNIVSFGRGLAGELLILSWTGEIYSLKEVDDI